MLNKDTFISSILIAILVIILNQKRLYMPDNFSMMLIVGLILVFLIFSVYLWQETKGDERDNYHKLNAGRISFFVGSAALILGIVFQAMSHEIDPWLIYTLVIMVIAKLASRIYSQFKQ